MEYVMTQFDFDVEKVLLKNALNAKIITQQHYNRAYEMLCKEFKEQNKTDGEKA